MIISIETRICKLLETKYGIPDLSKEGSTNEQKESGSGEVQNDAFEVVGNLASERPKNAIVTSEFDLLFGLESENGTVYSSTSDVAVPDAALSSDFL